MTNPLIPRLYKYLPCNDNTYESLSLPGFWCGSAVAMNDPFECMLNFKQSFSEDTSAYEYFRKTLAPHKDDPERRPFEKHHISQIPEVLKTFRERYPALLFFCALSKKPLNTLMWSHYANGHRGCVIGIDCPEHLLGDLAEIQYLDEPVSIDLKYFTDFHSHRTKNASPLTKMYSCKAPDWKYEGEWRIWVNDSGNIPIDKSQIKEVIFGARASDETKRTVAKLLNLKDDFQYEKAIVQYDPPRLEKSTTARNWGLEALSLEEVS